MSERIHIRIDMKHAVREKDCLDFEIEVFGFRDSGVGVGLSAQCLRLR